MCGLTAFFRPSSPKAAPGQVKFLYGLAARLCSGAAAQSCCSLVTLLWQTVRKPCAFLGYPPPGGGWGAGCPSWRLCAATRRGDRDGRSGGSLRRWPSDRTAAVRRPAAYLTISPTSARGGPATGLSPRLRWARWLGGCTSHSVHGFTTSAEWASSWFSPSAGQDPLLPGPIHEGLRAGASRPPVAGLGPEPRAPRTGG